MLKQNLKGITLAITPIWGGGGGVVIFLLFIFNLMPSEWPGVHSISVVTVNNMQLKLNPIKDYFNPIDTAEIKAPPPPPFPHVSGLS